MQVLVWIILKGWWCESLLFYSFLWLVPLVLFICTYSLEAVVGETWFLVKIMTVGRLHEIWAGPPRRMKQGPYMVIHALVKPLKFWGLKLMVWSSDHIDVRPASNPQWDLPKNPHPCDWHASKWAPYQVHKLKTKWPVLLVIKKKNGIKQSCLMNSNSILYVNK